MSCPYFYPVEPSAAGAPGETAMLPLGDRWAGLCAAGPGPHAAPEVDVIARLCNMGYARGECSQFPQGDGPDAVRFAVGPQSGPCVRIRYAVERDHHPFAHGALEYDPRSGEFVAPPAEEIFMRQARAYVESYLRRKNRAS